MKLALIWSIRKVRIVAPYVGAWIETHKSFILIIKTLVAPYVGAWIETKK